jgi:hypothetical protein
MRELAALLLLATLYGVGRCPAALSTQRRAHELIRETADRAEKALYTGKLAEYAKACGDGAP